MPKKFSEKLKYYLSAGKYMLKLEFQSQMEYPSFLIGWILSNAFQVLVGLGSIKVITMQFSSINGWSFEQIVFMYGIGYISHALSIMLFIQTWYLGYLVQQGGFDRMLLRPMSIYFQFCVYDLNMIGITDMIPGIIALIYGAVSVGFQLNFFNLLFLIATILGATMLRGGIYTMVGSVGFFTKSNRSLVSVVLTLFDKANSYPFTIYNRFIQGFFTFVLPLAFITFYPSSSFLGKDMGFSIPGIVPLWTLAVGALFMLLAHGLFKLGLRRYDSAGS